MNRQHKNPRLHFTDEERASPGLKKSIQKADKAADRVEAAKRKVHLRFDEDAPKAPSKLSHEVQKAPGKLVSEEAHRQVREAEDDNAGVQAAHGAEQTAESTLHMGESAYHAHKLKPYRDVAKAEQRLEQANVDVLYQRSVKDNPQAASNPISRFRQKQIIRKQYAAAKSGKAAEQTVKGAKRATQQTAKATEKAGAFVKKHGKGFMVVGVLAVMVIMLMNSLSSCSQVAIGTINSIVGTSYVSEDSDILAVDKAYTKLEDALDRRIDNIEREYAGYDEYRYDVDEIGHNPYVLMSYLTAKYVSFNLADVRDELDALFSQQYQLNFTEIIEIRYKTEPQPVPTIDPRTGRETTVTEDVEVPYEYRILSASLRNRQLAAVVAPGLDAEQTEMYAVLMEMRGNKPELFDENDNPFVGSLDVTPPEPYEIPPAALADPQFAALIAEANKYLGYPYVWGGSKPSTSFDCSGFVCWVLNQSGTASVGRTNARGLYKKSTVVSRSEANPGDLVFFTGARAAEIGHPVTHVGIYVGNGMMLHCAGNGVEYKSITDSKYYRTHLYAYGRLG